MSRTLTTNKRFVSAATLLVLGGAVTAATWVSGDHGFAVAIGIFYLLCTIGLYLIAGGRGDVAAIVRTDGDERQRSIDHEAARISGLVMGAVGIAGTIVQLARGEDPGGYAWVCTAGGISYVAALAVLRRRS